MAGVADPRGAVDGEPDVLVARGRRLARVHADPDAQVDALGPVVRGQRALRRDRRVDGVPRPAERDEERVAVGVELAARRRRPGAAEQALVIAEHGAVARRRSRRSERRRALDVA